jgi:phosphoenolpyruvate synthase/pyruvate phosphate dikinase
MQVRAIFEAACTVKKEGVDVRPEVMIPLTSHVNERNGIRSGHSNFLIIIRKR